MLPGLIAVPITRRIRSIPTEVFLDRSDGLPFECVVSVDNIQVVRKAHLVRRVSSLSPERLVQVCDALRFAVNC